MTGFREHTYIRRRGRMTKAQARAFDGLAGTFEVTPQNVVDVAGGAPLGIEIGFGMGHALLQWADAARDWQLFGIELYQPGIGALMDGLARAELTNVHVLEYPAQEVIAVLPDACIDEVRIFFPDPWPKKRHLKRRLIQPEFLQALARVVKPGAVVRLATDWAPYADWMRECFTGCEHFTTEHDETRTADAPSNDDAVRDTTNFERRGERLGHDITDFVYRRTD